MGARMRFENTLHAAFQAFKDLPGYAFQEGSPSGPQSMMDNDVAERLFFDFVASLTDAQRAKYVSRGQELMEAYKAMEAAANAATVARSVASSPSGNSRSPAPIKNIWTRSKPILRRFPPDSPM